MQFKIYNFEKYGYSEIKILKGKREINRLLKKYSIEQDEIKREAFTIDDLQYFIFLENDKWLAIDNIDRDLYIEEFNSLEKAIQYLINDYTFLLDEKKSNQMKKLIKRYIRNTGKYSLIYFRN